MILDAYQPYEPSQSYDPGGYNAGYGDPYGQYMPAADYGQDPYGLQQPATQPAANAYGLPPSSEGWIFDNEAEIPPQLQEVTTRSRQLRLMGRPTDPGMYAFIFELLSPMNWDQATRLAQNIVTGMSQFQLGSFVVKHPTIADRLTPVFGAQFEAAAESGQIPPEAIEWRPDQGMAYGDQQTRQAKFLAFYANVQEEIPIPPGLTAPITTIIDAQDGKVLREVGANGRVYVPPSPPQGLGAAPLVAAGFFAVWGPRIWAFVKWGSIALAAYYGYMGMQNILIRPAKSLLRFLQGSGGMLVGLGLIYLILKTIF